MLLVKYEKFEILKKDSYLEELVYKFEKNIEHFHQFDAKAKKLLQIIITNGFSLDLNSETLT